VPGGVGAGVALLGSGQLIGVDPQVLARIEGANAEIAKAKTELSKAGEAISPAGMRVFARAIDEAVRKTLENVEAIGKFAGLDEEETRNLRQGLETVEGGLHAGRKVLPYALALRGPAGLALEVGAVALGAAGGYGKEEARRLAATSALADADQEYAVLASADEAIARFKATQAARRRAGSIR
jgi:hypothetical protein